MKKTKIVCSIGPASSSRNVIKKMVKAGMNVLRINFSHGNKEDFKKYISLMRSVDDRIPIIADLKGTEMRVYLKKPSKIRKNDTVKICGSKKEGCVAVSYRNIHTAVMKNSLILLDDGLIKLRVFKIKNEVVYCKALNSNTLTNNKKVNIPHGKIKIKFPTRQDKEDVQFAVNSNIEFLALSFVKTKEDVESVRALIKNSRIMLIAKIETSKAVSNFKEILEVSDGVMVARGDLGVEMHPEEVPYLQKQIIKECNNKGKPVIVATQMLESMIKNTIPTRAETSDVANAILDGADAVMLSGESAVGKYPVNAVEMMTRIANKVESLVESKVEIIKKSISENISQAVCSLAKSVADRIIITTVSGFTARMVTRFKPKKPVIAVTHDPKIRNQLMLSWGVTPLLYSKNIKHGPKAILESVKACYKNNLVAKEDTVVITGGIARGESGHTNLIEVHKVSELMPSF